MKQPKSEVITIGTELLLGEIANTNAQWLSEQSALNGIDIYYHTVVGDNLARVEAVFKQAQERSDIIIVSGGLGPTEDDMTREAFEQMSGLSMTEHLPSIKKIETYFNRQQVQMTINNRRQARVFNDAFILNNELGMAPGMIVTYQDKTWIFLPGVPKEMKQMSVDGMFPYLKKLTGQQMIIKSMNLRFIGIGESRLETELSDIIRLQQNPTIALLSQSDGIVIRLTAKDTSTEKVEKLLEQAKDEILTKVGNYFYGSDKETLEVKLVNTLKQKHLKLSAAESLTGGMFIQKLISSEGASDVSPGGVVCYDVNVKRNVLGVSAETIESEGVVSRSCALELAKNICSVLDSNIGISFTGVAGPGLLEGHKVGTVYIAIYSISGKQLVEKFDFDGDREAIRYSATLKGFELLLDFLK